MKLKKFLIGLVCLMLVASFMNPDLVSAEENPSAGNFDCLTDKISIDKTNKDILSLDSSKKRATGHNTADTALYLDESYIGQVLMDGATSEENWYYFYANEKTKYTALLEQPTDGDYDIVLYSLNTDTGVLSAVASSGYGGNVIDRLSAVNETAGYYFLQVLPSTASVTTDSMYYFVINSVTNYDSKEPNDNPSQSNSYVGSNISLNGTIDNVFDQDWTKITLTGTKNYQIDLNNVPSGAQYSVVIYDENLNVKSSMISEGNNKTYVSLSAGTYYICVATYNNQYSESVGYTFKMNQVHSLSSTFYTTKGGHNVEVTNSSVYVDGSYVDLNWSFLYNLLYTRSQTFTVTSSTAVDASTYQNGTFKDGQNINKSSDCIRVKINNFSMSYYCNNPYASWSKTFGENSWTYFYIDAATGKTIGTDANYYHTNMGITNSFTKF